MLDFDVTRRVPRNIEASVWTRSVNLMCNLLHGIDYQALYGEEILTRDDSGWHLFDNLIQNVSQFSSKLDVDAAGDPFPVAEILIDAFGDIKNVIEAFPHQIKLGDFFSIPRVENKNPLSLDGVKNFIIDRLERVHTDHSERMKHFCTPFVEVQKGRAELSKPEDMADFLGALGGKTLKQFHTAPRTTTAQGKAVKAATDAGILRVKRKSGSYSIYAHDGNGKWCCRGNCVSSGHPETWCLEVYVNGQKYCALGGDFDPTCISIECEETSNA